MLGVHHGVNIRRFKSLRGEVTFTTPGTYTWNVPFGVYEVCAVAVGGGASGGGGGNTYSGGGGALAWRNAIPVTPGQVVTITVGGANQPSSVLNMIAGGGSSSSGGVPSGTYDGGGRGGNGSTNNCGDACNGGGGAGGYTGAGGNGGGPCWFTPGTDGAGGGGGGGASSHGGVGGYGGGVGLYGIGANGTGGKTTASEPGQGGSGGTSGGFGAGGPSGYGATQGASGAVRIMWGLDRSFPSNAKQEETSYSGVAITNYSQYLQYVNNYVVQTTHNNNFHQDGATLNSIVGPVGTSWVARLQPTQTGGTGAGEAYGSPWNTGGNTALGSSISRTVQHSIAENYSDFVQLITNQTNMLIFTTYIGNVGLNSPAYTRNSYTSASVGGTYSTVRVDKIIYWSFTEGRAKVAYPGSQTVLDFYG